MSAFRRIIGLTQNTNIISALAPCNVRTLKSTLRVKWVRPTKLPTIHPSNSGDGSPMPKIHGSMVLRAFEDSEELKTADENVKKIFQVDMNDKMTRLDQYMKMMEDKVKRHAYDRNTHEVYIAHLTAKIRFLQEYYKENPKDKKNKLRLYRIVDRRNKQLKHLRRWDYPRFEWVIEKLDIFYKPDPNPFEQVTRKKSVTQLTTILCEEIKEKKLANFKREMDASKVGFLEKKLDKLRWIMNQENQFDLPKTVTDEDIAECESLLSKVRLESADLVNKKYERTIHPYTLEKYHPEELLRAEGKIKDEH